MLAQEGQAPPGTRLGFACRWREPRELTWSGSAHQLFTALARRCDVVDLPIGPPRHVAALMRRAERLGLTGGTPWAMTTLEDYRAQHQLRRMVAHRDVDAVLEIGDLGESSVPYYTYIDLTYEAANRAAASLGGTGAPPLPPRTMQRKHNSQRRFFAGARGIFTMGHWIADELARSGVPAEKLHVVGAGCNVVVPPRLRDADPSALRLLFLGRDFVRKGGDAVVGALAGCREAGARHTLTIAGPPQWPLSYPVPEGVVFRGPVSAGSAAELLLEHDVLLMPSRVEAFGIALLEALASGMPVIARRAYAMEELVPQDRGVLVDEASPTDVAQAIHRLAGDPEVWQRCFDQALTTQELWSWAAVAERVLAVVA